AWISRDDDPARYSAIEEACLRDSQSSFLILWINRPSLFVGKNQNLWAEVSASEAYRTGVSLNRRLSGGGTVYHDPGNLNFSLISPGEPKIAFQEHVHYLFPYFKERSIEVEIRNRSDLFHQGRKFSGNAEYFTSGRVLHHGTLLFQTDLQQLGRFLTPDSNSYTDRAIDSNRSQTVNLQSLLPEIPDTYAFAEDLLHLLLHQHPELHRVDQLSQELLDQSEKYLPHFRSPEWIFGRSPKYQLERRQPHPSGFLHSHISVENGRIERIELSAEDSRRNPELRRIALDLHGCLHRPESVQSCLERFQKEEANETMDLSSIWLELFF
ncbi:MAG: lipoate--protein ligase, partial [Puniceicoccales bacterium]